MTRRNFVLQKEHNQWKSEHSEFSRAGWVWRFLRKLLGSKEHLDWLKIDLNVVKIVTVQNYKLAKN